MVNMGIYLLSRIDPKCKIGNHRTKQVDIILEMKHRNMPLHTGMQYRKFTLLYIKSCLETTHRVANARTLGFT